MAVAALVFATTNADDLVILAAFFSDPLLRVRSVVLGQVIGIALLTAVSAVAALGSMAIQASWIALLGVVPLALGLRKLIALRRRNAEEPSRAPVQGSQLLAVAAVTLANGGDNLGVYIPLFASRPAHVPVFGAVFGVLTLAWCAIGWWLVRAPLVGTYLRRYGRVILPFVLIAVGLHVLKDARPLLDP